MKSEIKGNKIIQIFILFIFMSTTVTKSQSVQTVPDVDLKKYSGKWYEVHPILSGFRKVVIVQLLIIP